MEWLNEFVKMLKGSITLALALFVATLVTLVLPMVYPGSFPVVPDIWRIPVQVACLFSFVLVALWAADGLAKKVAGWSRKIRMLPIFNRLTSDEVHVLMQMGEHHSTAWFDLDRIPTENGQRLHTVLACKSLQKKGLLKMGFGSTIVLTDQGLERAAMLLVEAEEVRSIGD